MWLSDLTLVLRERLVEHGSIRIEEGLIAELAERPVPGGIACGGLELFPGFIDLHGDMIEQEIEPRVRVDFPMEVALAHLDARLAAAGVTTAYAAVSFSRREEEKRESRSGARSSTRRGRSGRSTPCAATAASITVFTPASTSPSSTPSTRLPGLLEDGAVDLVSLMDHTPGQGQYRDVERHVELVAAQRGVSRARAQTIVTDRIAANARPPEVLLGNLHAVASLCRRHGVALASHDDDTADKARLMADLGARVSEFPVTVEAAEAAVGCGMMTAMGAPNAMRGQSYSGNLSARDAHARGLLHILAADYHPGAILPAVRALARTDPDGLAGAARLVTAHPADALGLDDRGELAPGRRADLALVAPGPIERVVASFREGVPIHADSTLALGGGTA